MRRRLIFIALAVGIGVAGGCGGSEIGEAPPPGGADLDCIDIRHPVAVTGPDYHRLDLDRDGVGCEAW